MRQDAKVFEGTRLCGWRDCVMLISKVQKALDDASGPKTSLDWRNSLENH